MYVLIGGSKCNLKVIDFYQGTEGVEHIFFVYPHSYLIIQFRPRDSRRKLNELTII